MTLHRNFRYTARPGGLLRVKHDGFGLAEWVGPLGHSGLTAPAASAPEAPGRPTHSGRCGAGERQTREETWAACSAAAASS